MSDAKHTPGVVDRIVNGMETGWTDEHTRLALLAEAAPELLEALEELFDGYVVAMHGARTCDCDESVGHVLCSPCKARAAIAKAKGQA